MKSALTSKELEARFRKARNPNVVELSGEMTVQARAAHIQAFTADAKRCSPRKSLFLIAIREE